MTTGTYTCNCGWTHPTSEDPAQRDADLQAILEHVTRPHEGRGL